MQPAAVSLPPRVPSTITAALASKPASLLDSPWATRSMGVGMSPLPKALNIDMSSLLSNVHRTISEPCMIFCSFIGGRPITTDNGLQWAFVFWTYTAV